MNTSTKSEDVLVVISDDRDNCANHPVIDAIK